MNKRVCRRYERLTTKLNQNNAGNQNGYITSSDSSALCTLTPRKLVAEELCHEVLSPRKVSHNFRTRLVFRNELSDKIKLARHANGLKGYQIT